MPNHAARQFLTRRRTVTPKTADDQVEVIRLLKIVRDTAVKAQATTMVTLKAVLVTASGLLRERLEPLTKKYQVGSSFPAGDGCNTCSSNSPKTVICTEADCGCENGGNWNKDYVSESPEECDLLDYVCVEGLTCFHDHCGCGCEQPADCPATIDCEPPTDCESPHRLLGAEQKVPAVQQGAVVLHGTCDNAGP